MSYSRISPFFCVSSLEKNGEQQFFYSKDFTKKKFIIIMIFSEGTVCNGAENESPPHIHPIGSFSINDSNGSENVTFKMN